MAAHKPQCSIVPNVHISQIIVLRVVIVTRDSISRINEEDCLSIH